MKVSNQKPAVLSPIYDAVIKGDFDPNVYMKKTIAAPLYEPLVATAPVEIKSNNRLIDEDEVTDTVLACMGDVHNPVSEKTAKILYGKTLVYFDAKSTLTIQDIFAIQAAVQEKLPEPSATTVYTPATDVIPACKEFLAGQCSFEKMFASLDFYARPLTLGFSCVNEQAFEDFKTWLATEVSQIATALDAKTNQLFADFQNISLKNLTESLILRNDDGDNNEEFSFARTLIAYAMKYAKTVSPTLFSVLPFNLGELFVPKTVVFVNIEAHAHASAKQVADEWKIINMSLKNAVKVVSNNKLSKLTGTYRTLNKIQSSAAAAAANGSGMGVQRAARAHFRKTPPTSVDMTRLVKRIISKMAHVAKSDNSYKSVKMSFARPNRRNPDDFNKQGKVVSTKYKPDIHLYIDTSGSISERNYQDAVKACITMARKLNVNLYFNSFSHVLSQCTHLKTRDKSLKQVYSQFQKVPKVTGGTDYAQIWDYINASTKRQRELSILMTDFEYHAPNHFIKHPKNLYYIPVSNMDWKYMVQCAESFADSMMHNDPRIRQHLLF